MNEGEGKKQEKETKIKILTEGRDDKNSGKREREGEDTNKTMERT